jgi:hypothetical protein
MNTREDIRRELEDIAPLLARHKQQFSPQAPVHLPPFGECQSAVLQQLNRDRGRKQRLSLLRPWLSIAATLALLVPMMWWLLRPAETKVLSFDLLSQEDILAYISDNPHDFDNRQLEEILLQEGTEDELHLPPMSEDEQDALLEEVLLDMHDTDLESTINH